MPKVREIQVDSSEKVKSVYCFLIAPEMKRKGIAKHLLEYVCQDAAVIGCIAGYLGTVFVEAGATDTIRLDSSSCICGKRDHKKLVEALCRYVDHNP